MSSVFISYSSKDRKKAKMFVDLLEGAEFKTWWDKDIPPGARFDQAIDNALNSAKCILVLWSKNSIQSDWVLEEALEAQNRNILIPVKLDKVELPFGYRRYQAIDFSGWRGNSNSENVRIILNAVALKTGKKLRKGEELDDTLWEKFLKLLGVDIKENKVADKKNTQKTKRVKKGKSKRRLTGGLDGKTIVFTGKLKEPRRIQELKVSTLGGKFVDSVSSKTSILVVGDKPGSEKINAAKRHGTYKITEKEWMNLLNRTYKKIFQGKRIFLTERKEVVKKERHGLRIVRESVWEDITKTL